MIKKNPTFTNLAAGYLFPEIGKRRRAFAGAHPDADIVMATAPKTTSFFNIAKSPQWNCLFT